MKNALIGRNCSTPNATLSLAGADAVRFHTKTMVLKKQL